MSEPFFEARALSFAYPNGPEVLRGLDLVVPRGVYAVLLGANGSGKSTLSRHVNGLLRPTAGTARTFGIDAADAAGRLAVRRRVGMVFQVPDNQIVATTVEDDVAFGPENLGLPSEDIARRVDGALGATGLETLRLRPPHLLSGGQKQALAVAGALAMGQEALVLDEATSMLDGRGRAALLDLVGRLHAEGATILSVTHRMEEAALADLVFVLHDGRIAAQGPPREVFRQADLLRACRLVPPDVTEMSLRLARSVPGFTAVALEPAELTSAILAAAPPAPPGPAASVPAQAAAPTNADPGERDRLIEAEGVCHRYLKGTPFEHLALESGDLRVGPGEAVAIVGHAGSGKSTLMQHLNGLLRPDGGRLRVADVDLAVARPDVWAVRRRVGLLFQRPEDQLFEQLVGDDIAFGPFQMGFAVAEARERVRWAMEVAGLDFEAFKDRPVFSLSGGQKRRVALAGVLALRPEVLVLDEPLSGLDPLGARELLSRLERLKTVEGVALVFVTHHLDEVLALADRVVVLHGGRTAAELSVAEILSEPDRIAAFGLELPGFLATLAELRRHGVLGADAAARTAEEAADVIAARLRPPVAAGAGEGA